MLSVHASRLAIPLGFAAILGLIGLALYRERGAPHAPSAAAAGASVTVRLRRLPRDALVRVDGAQVDGDTFHWPRQARKRRIEVSLHGRTIFIATHVATQSRDYDTLSLVGDGAPARVMRERRMQPPVRR